MTSERRETAPAFCETAGAQPCVIMSQVATYYLGVNDIARELGLSRSAVNGMREHFRGYFPEPDAWTGVDELEPGKGPEDPPKVKVPEDPRDNPRANGKSVPGWLPERLKEIRRIRDEVMPGAGTRSDLKDRS